MAYTPVTTGWDGARLLCGNHIAPSHWALSSTDILKQYCVVLLILSFVHQPGAVHHRSDAPQLGHHHIIHFHKHRRLFIRHKFGTKFGPNYMKINNVNEYIIHQGRQCKTPLSQQQSCECYPDYHLVLQCCPPHSLTAHTTC